MLEKAKYAVLLAGHKALLILGFWGGWVMDKIERSKT